MVKVASRFRLVPGCCRYKQILVKRRHSFSIGVRIYVNFLQHYQTLMMFQLMLMIMFKLAKHLIHFSYQRKIKDMNVISFVCPHRKN
jgi:hypothetical protein